MIGVFRQDGAEEGAVAQRGRRLVGQRVAGGAHGTLLAFALKEKNLIVDSLQTFTNIYLNNKMKV